MTKRVKIHNGKPAGKFGRKYTTSTTHTDGTSSAGTKNYTSVLLFVVAVIIGIITYITLR